MVGGRVALGDALQRRIGNPEEALLQAAVRLSQLLVLVLDRFAQVLEACQQLGGVRPLPLEMGNLLGGMVPVGFEGFDLPNQCTTVQVQFQYVVELRNEACIAPRSCRLELFRRVTEPLEIDHVFLADWYARFETAKPAVYVDEILQRDLTRL